MKYKNNTADYSIAASQSDSEKTEFGWDSDILTSFAASYSLSSPINFREII